MRAIYLLPILLAGCGSFPLGYVQPQAGKTNEQRSLDMLVCKDEARLQAGTSERQVASFLAGLTIVGAPFAVQADKQKQREVFAKCMNDKGYTVRPPD